MFGAATPFEKKLLDDIRPQLLAGLLYLGACIVLGVVLATRRRNVETRLRREDVPRLLMLAATGGVVAPVFLLVGLERVTGSSGALLLNLEGPFTVVLGVWVFREHLGRRGVIGAVVVFAAGALLSASGPIGGADRTGALLIVLACLLWGLDNNLTRTLTLRDPFAIVAVKAGVAALVNVTLGIALGARLPSAGPLLAALALGAVAYGVSIVLDAYALRFLGAAREAVFFAAAPFVGALLAGPVLSEAPSRTDVIAGIGMVAGIALMFRDDHGHRHSHMPTVHDHVHHHDEHHAHPHDAGEIAPHAHEHAHEPLSHAHSHVSDVHHRHAHD